MSHASYFQQERRFSSISLERCRIGAIHPMNDSNKEIVSELDFFLRPTEDDKSSLMSKITTLEFGCTVEDSQGPYLEDEGVTLRSSLLSTERET